MAFIRRYDRQRDEEAMIHIFRETASADLKAAGDPTLHFSSFIWARPYMFLSQNNNTNDDDEEKNEELSSPKPKFNIDSSHTLTSRDNTALATSSITSGSNLATPSHSAPPPTVSPASSASSINFVIDNGQGVAVGYILGVPNTQRFVDEYRRRYLPSYVQKLHKIYVNDEKAEDDVANNRDGDKDENEGEGQNKKGRTTEKGTETQAKVENSNNNNELQTKIHSLIFHPEIMLHTTTPSLLQRYPAHLHIDILPSHQRRGWGQKLIATLLSAFEDLGVPGVHLGKVGTNVDAGRFYARLGFERFEGVLDGGMSGEKGREGDGGVVLVKRLV